MSWKLSDLQIPPPENEYDFEDLCLTLYRLKFGDKTQKNGSRGQSQDGVDIFCPDQYIGIQCKKKEFGKKLPITELQKEVQKAKKFQPSLKRLILATTCKRDAKIQETARLISEEHKKENLFSVEVHSWDDIKGFDEFLKVYQKYYNTISSNISDILQFSQSNSQYQELNKIRDLMNKENKPETAFNLLEKFKSENWDCLKDNKEKYKVLTNMGCAKIDMKQEIEGSKLLIEAFSYKPNDEDSNFNCAMAYFIIGDTKKSKEFLKKVKKINPLSIGAFILEIQIKYKEKQSLKEIISSIPESLKTKYQIAHILTHISIHKKDYTEAEKWLNIFYTNKEQDKDEIIYSEMFLKLILERKDVLSGQKIPDTLKDKLLEIVKIYEKFITNQKYDELKKFNPDWYLYYAISLELNGDINQSISILEEGIRKFPKDDTLKIELGHLFSQKGDIEKHISILENQLNLKVSKIDNTLINIDQINLSDKTIGLALNLTDLYFHNKQKEKFSQLLNHLENNKFISEDNRLEIKHYKIFRLLDLKKIIEAEQLLKPLFQKDENNIMNLILCSKIEAFKEKSNKEKVVVENHRSQKIKYLKKACSILKKEISDSLLGYTNKKHLDYIQQILPELDYAEMYEESEFFLEEITDNNLNHPDIFNLLHDYFKNGKNKKAINLAKKLFKKFPNNLKSVNILFRIYESLGDNKIGIQYYEEFLKKNEKNDFVRIELALAYIKNKDVSKAKKMLENSFDIKKLSSDQVRRLSWLFMKIEKFYLALDILYKYIKLNPKELEPQNAYFSLITFSDPQNNLNEIQNQEEPSNALKLEETKLRKSLHPKKIGIDCYVEIKENTEIENLKNTEIIIEEDAEIYTPDHEFSKALLGKKEEDKFSFQDKKYQIIKIQSKYIHKHQKIVEETEKKYPSKPFVRPFSLKKFNESELSKLLKKMQPNASKQHEVLDQSFKLYSEGKVTIGYIAKKFSMHSIEIIGWLIFSKKYKWISDFSYSDIIEKERQELLDTKTDILVDISSLIMIHQLKIEKYIEESQFKLYICQSTITSLQEHIQTMTLHSKSGYLTMGLDKEDNLRKNFVSSERIKQDLIFWMKVKKWAEDYCLIKPISEDIVLSRKERKENENIFGKDFFDSLLAVDSNSIFLCEDVLLRQIGKLEYSISGIRLFDLIIYFERHAIIDNNQVTQYTEQLIRFNQTYISIDHNILLNLLKSSDYSINDIGFQNGLYFLSSVSELQGVVSVIAKFFIEICQTASLLPHMKQIIIKETLNKVTIGRPNSPKAIAHQIIFSVAIYTKLLPLLQNEIERYIKEWLSGKIYY